MNWYRKATDKYNLGTPWPRYPVDEEGIREYIEEQSKLPSRWTPVDSSFIKEVAYHRELKYLDIRLVGGRTYTFADVPQRIYDNFMRSRSKGEYFNKVIKKNYVESE